MRRELEDYRHGAAHDLVSEMPPGTYPCRCCPQCKFAAQDYPEHMAYIRKPGTRTAADEYADRIAAIILDSIAKHDNLLGRVYGMLTGNCCCCHATLTDPKSKLIGIGPDCRGYR
jgi:hypothetical protein